ncbi:TPA: hypothetical protein N5O10_001480 [Enterobacter hormaechei subsp. steigerwaltii]|nr:hypothetical protein [Enterobacter hormaechei subsp. steigerwaltii]
METINVKLTGEWVQISDGVMTSDMHVESGTAQITLSNRKPADETGSHTMHKGIWMKIPAPLMAWAKTNLEGSEISISKYKI